MFFTFLYRFNALMSEIIFFKKIILVYFQAKKHFEKQHLP
jgi:hypothetical protein